MMQNYHKLFLFTCLLLLPSVAVAWVFHTSHNDPVAPVILGVTGILFVALIGRFSARKLGFPSVIGELIMGIIAGNLAFYYQVDLITVLREGPAIFDTMENLLKGEGLELPVSTQLALKAAGIFWIFCVVRMAMKYCRSLIPSTYFHDTASSFCCFSSASIPALMRCSRSVQTPAALPSSACSCLLRLA